MTLTDLDQLALLTRRIAEKRPKHDKFMKAAIKGLNPAELAEASRYIRHLLETNSEEYIVDAYLTILDDTMQAQIDFLRTKEYRFSKFAEVADAVYFNKDYMTKYMIGLAVSEFIWPNHIAIRRYFEKVFPSRKGGRYLEIGPGHGFFLLHAMKHGSLDNYMAVDISAASIALTDQIVRQEAPELRSKLELLECDFLDGTSLTGPYDVLVMGEVLEHVERPQAFMQRLHELAAPGAQLFVTTCVNAPAVDHIYLFRKEQEVVDLFIDAGLSVKDRLVIPYPGYTIEQSVDQELPINVAYVLTK